MAVFAAILWIADQRPTRRHMDSLKIRNGVLAAAASGLVAFVFLLGFVRGHTYAPFVVYRLIVAALVLLIISTGLRAASF